ncbi:alpha/beta fold hydrolase [Mechercharimyces sp. CAU 1602]|uniref:alpha/beta fold hydrolase n=1 Tax=Mechercharimyces sp. CAU 1602 TaxID=2973933 RepID=UPI0021636746|nr:alpha/beta hydrolase [Mechercharimyces sp. CAU 1602]MCS1351564.1 alpha/beta hydrolase [Mechercharimyces sp. CAU 1602]
MDHHYIHVNNIQLHYLEKQGKGPNVLLLHGLMGRAAGWFERNQWQSTQYRVVAFDQRGHGLSEKVEDDYSRDQYINDIITVIENLKMKPTVLIGHSLGALYAWGVAARRPDLVSGLIIEDMSVVQGEKQAEWREWLDSWPIPFPDLKAAHEFFGAYHASSANNFMELLVKKSDGYRPMVQFEHIIQTIAGYENREYWDELDHIECPTLVVGGEESHVAKEELIRMADRLNGTYIEVPHAGHVIHYDQPEAWQVLVDRFIAKL